MQAYYQQNQGPIQPDHLPDLAVRPPNFPTIEMALPPHLPTALLLLSALRRRCQLVVGLGLVLAALVSAVAWYVIPPAKYTARALLQVASSQPKMIFKTEENRVDFGTYQKTQITLLKSRRLLNKALMDPKVSKLAAIRSQVDPTLWLEKRIQADYVGEVLRITMSGDKPDDLAVLVNSVADAYRKEVVEVESKERWSRHDELKKIYDEYQVKLEQRRNELKKLSERVGSKDKQTMRHARELAMDRLSTARRELIQTQADLRRAKAEYEILSVQEQDRAASKPVGTEAAIQQWVNEDVEVKQFKERIESVKTAIARASRLSRETSDPSLQPKLNELATLRKALAAKMATLRPLALERLNDTQRSSEDLTLRDLGVRVGVLEGLVKVTQAVYDEQANENQEIGKDALYIDAIQDEIAHADNAAKRIGEELEALSVELRAPSRVQQHESADTPRKEDDKRVTFAGLAGCGTFALFALGIALLELNTRRIGSVNEVTNGLGVRVVGALPPIYRRRRWVKSIRGPAPQDGSLLIESIDSIRTMILHSSGDHGLSSVMITSATSGEGKSSLACHLATSLARSGLKTLLIDCDLRKPSIHRLFDVPVTPGFSEFLRGTTTADEVIRPTTVEGLDLIAAGTCDARTLRALARANPGTILDAFRESHDFIVIDTSPVLPVTDALLVGRHVDAALYSVLSEVSRLPWTVAAVDRIKMMNIRLLGAVVTGVRPHAYATYYGNNAREICHD